MRAAVMCAVINGDPPFTFSWHKDGVTIREQSSISLKSIDEFTSTLIITKLGPESNGNYSCKVSNTHGTDEKFDILSMKGNRVQGLCSVTYTFGYKNYIFSL